jgi:hypothetical protein
MSESIDEKKKEGKKSLYLPPDRETKPMSSQPFVKEPQHLFKRCHFGSFNPIFYLIYQYFPWHQLY